jgi:hypothetical protein
MVISILEVKVVFDVNAFLKDYVERPTGKVVKWIKENVEKRREQKLDESKFKFITRLFGIEDKVGLRPGGEHPAFENYLHPDDREALFYITGLINNPKLKAHQKWIGIVDPAYNIICLGGPVSNFITRQNMGYQRRGDDFLKVSDFPIDFPFLFDLSKERSRQITKRYTGGKVHKEYNWPIITPSGLLNSKVTKGWLEENYLIITRMPNLSNEIAWKERKDLIIISGTHGTGTRALELLFETAKVLKSIVEEVGEACYYQSLLRVPEIIHDTQWHDSLPLRIEHIKSEPLLIKDDRINFWFKKMKG